MEGGDNIEAKTMKPFRLSSESIEYIFEIKEKNHLSSQTAALEQIIFEHKNKPKHMELVNNIADEIEARFKDGLTGIRLSSRFADKNVQIILEMLNTLCINRGLEDAYLTDTVPSGVYEDSKNAVEERIKNYREIQISNSKKKKTKETEKFLY
mgnify:CR=1 FL=1